MLRYRSRLLMVLLILALSALSAATACPPSAPTACVVSTSEDVPIRYGTSIRVKFSGASDIPSGQALNYYVSSRHMTPTAGYWSSWTKDTLSPTSWIFNLPAGTKLQWRCRVQCGFLFWSKYYEGGGPVTIQNTPPTPPTACVVSPLPADTTTVLTALASGATDVDGQSLTYDYHWYCQQTNGVFAEVFHGNPLPAERTSGNQVWMVRVYSSDGVTRSETAFTSAQFTIANAPPTQPTTLTIKPTAPQAGDTVKAEAKGSTDPDNVSIITDAISYEYQWYRRVGSLKPRLMGSSATLNSSAMRGGQTWFVKARAADSHGGKSPWRSLDFTVANTPPTAPTAVTITPATPNEDQDLIGSATGQYDADGDALTLTYQWVRYERIQPFPGPLGKTLPASATSPLQVWAVRAKVSDASSTSAWTYSSKVTIVDVNHPPPAPTSCVITTPAPITEGDNLTTSVLADSDPDGDALTTEYQWSWQRPGEAWGGWFAGTGTRLANAVEVGYQYRVRARSVATGQASAWTESPAVTVLSIIVSTTPENAATGIGRRSSLLIQFRKPMQGSDVASRFTLLSGGFDGSPVAGAISWPQAGRQMKFKPDVPLGAATHYTAVLSGGSARTDGNLVLLQHSFAFDTNDNPTVVGWWPTGSSAGVAARVSVTFDRAMNFETVKAGFALTPNRAGTWTHSDDLKTFTFDPTTNFPAGIRYTVCCAATTQDAGGTSMGVPFEWAFRTRAASPAPVTATLTAASAGGNAQFTLTLSTAAQVQVSLCNVSGRTVAVLPVRTLPAGLSTLLWNGRATTGSKVPPGAYLVRCRVVSEDGSALSSLTPLSWR